MPRWICPSCSSVMTVKPEHLGQSRACLKCGASSIVTDADAAPTLPQVEPLSSQSIEPVQMGGARSVLAVIAVMWLLGEFIEFNRLASARIESRVQDEMMTACFGRSFIVAALYIVAWQFLTLVADTRETRIRLDEIAKQLKNKP